MYEVGQTVYFLSYWNSRPNRLQTALITKIGRVYITVKIHGREEKFHKDTLKQKETGYGIGYNYKLFLTLEEYERWVERNAILETIEREVQRYGWLRGKNDDALHEIARALGVEKAAEDLAKKKLCEVQTVLEE